MPSLEAGWLDQWVLQRMLHTGVHPSSFTEEEKVRYVKDMVLACTDELHEALQEVGWKPWASSRHIHREAYVAELVDAWQFLMNLFQVVGATPEEVAERLRNKHAINRARIDEEYTGVKKCSNCHRAFDDPHVKCTEDTCYFQAVM